MSLPSDSDLRHRYSVYGQDHVWSGWDTLTERERRNLLEQLRNIDLALVQRLWKSSRETDAATAETPGQRAERARPPAALIRLPRNAGDREPWKQARQRGEELLSRGKVGALLVAGGQGTRLGFDHPKGMFPIGPVTGHSLFQLFCEQLRAFEDRYGRTIPYYIMTSDATHEETVDFFEKHAFFGLSPEALQFFKQGNMPAVAAETGKLMLEKPGQLALSPDGHGGVLAALKRAGLFDEMRSRGIEVLYYHQVDNPLAKMLEPEFLGWHALRKSDISTKVVPKTGPEEKMGVACDIDGRTQIVEYSDLPDAIAQRRTADGQLELWAGSTAMHVLNRSFLERMAANPEAVPFHIARKKVPCWDAATGAVVEPEAPNAVKFEHFLFDVMPHADCALIVEGDREREFNPVKNATGVNSPDDVKQSLVALHRQWLEGASSEATFADRPVEISPLVALDADDVRRWSENSVTMTDREAAGVYFHRD